jgi:hypothetical protein
MRVAGRVIFCCPTTVWSADERGIASDVAFLRELAAFLASRWKAWLQPILVILLIAAGLLAFANALPRLIAAPAGDRLAPVSRDDYRHDGAWLNRY